MTRKASPARAPGPTPTLKTPAGIPVECDIGEAQRSPPARSVGGLSTPVARAARRELPGAIASGRSRVISPTKPERSGTVQD